MWLFRNSQAGDGVRAMRISEDQATLQRRLFSSAPIETEIRRALDLACWRISVSGR
jgi:hypothetical protein